MNKKLFVLGILIPFGLSACGGSESESGSTLSTSIESEESSQSSENPPHTHSFSSSYSYDDDVHFHVCECGAHDEDISHSFGEWVVTVEPTTTKDGKAERICSVCLYKQKRTLKKLSHYEINVYLNNNFYKKYDTDIDGNYVLDIPEDKDDSYFAGYFDQDNHPFSINGVVNKNTNIKLVFGTEPFVVSDEATLDYALNSGIKNVLLDDDLSVTKPHYVKSSVTLNANKNVTITRDKDYMGDMFVVGVDEDNTIIAKDTNPVALTLDAQSYEITIDGNSTNIDTATKSVVGSQFFVAGLSTLTLNNSINIINNKKNDNERILSFDSSSTSSLYPFVSNAKKVGGSAIINIDSEVVLNGTTFTNNEVNNINDVKDDDSLSSYGGVIFNQGELNIVDASFDNNTGSYGSVIYTSRAVNIEKGTFENNYSYNYGTVFLGDSQYSSCIIDSLDSNNVVFSSNEAVSSGGAIFVSSQASLVVDKAKFIDNIANTNGGAICSKGITSVDNSIFKNNSVHSKGGAIYQYYEDSTDTDTAWGIDISNSTFENNSGSLGSAVSFGSEIESDPSAIVHYVTGAIDGCTFKSNTAVKNLSDKYGHGTIYAQKKAEVTIQDSSFEDNSAVGYGGVFYVTDYASVTLEQKDTERDYGNIIKNNIGSERAGVAYITSNGSFASTNSLFEGNHNGTNVDGGGGAFYIYSTNTVSFDSDTFKSNSTTAKGGAIFSTTSSYEVDNCSFINNSSDTGGALYLTSASSCTIDDSSFTGNSANNGGAIEAYTNAQCTINNTSFTNNTADNNGGALYAYTNAVVRLTDVTASNNNADNYGGLLYQSGAATVYMTDITSTANSANNGGFIYITTTNSTLYIYSGSTTSCTSTVSGAQNIHSNTNKTKIYIKGTDTKSHFDYDNTLLHGSGTINDID